MTDERPQSNRDGDLPPLAPPPSDEEVFERAFAREPAQADLFASLAQFAAEPPPVEASGFNATASLGNPPPLPPTPMETTAPAAGAWTGSRLSRVQKMLVAGISAMAMALLYVLLLRSPAAMPNLTPSARASAEESGEASRSLKLDGRSEKSEGPWASEKQTANFPPQTSPSASEDQPSTIKLPTSPASLPGPEPLSLQLADRLYLRRDFEPALALYDRLYRQLPPTGENQPVRDFLLLRLALCSKNSGNLTQADGLLRTVSLSRLPLLQALARYHQSVALVSRQRYPEAAAKAYQTMALIEVANFDQKWVAAVRQECGLLAAEAVTRNLLALCDADANLPPSLWSGHADIDPFVEMDEPRLRVFLTSGTEQLDATVLSPQIRRISDEADAPRWSVLCNGAPVEELLARFAANAHVNIRWPGTVEEAQNAKPQEGEKVRMEEGRSVLSPSDRLAFTSSSTPVDDNIRARPVYLYLTAATELQVVTAAAGSLGLIAQTDEKGDVQVLDPTSYSSLADHTRLLAEDAITLWQRFLLAAGDDPRAGNAHFALALLQTVRGRFDEALAEYKLIANHYLKHALAPYALLQAGLLKASLRDYTGAHADLKQLVELYPDSNLCNRACLYLADTTQKAGLYAEAAELYRKVYNLGGSPTAEARATLGAGRCFYETKKYEEAARWLSRYVDRARNQGQPEFSTACLLLGKAYLALHQPRPAQAALNLAVRGELSRPQHVETVAVLVRTYLEQGLFLEALSALEDTTGWQLSQQEAVEMTLLRTQALRSIGLADKARVLLEERSQYLPSPDLQAKVSLALAQCCRDSGDWEAARQALGSSFALVEPGPLADEIGRTLAQVCLRLGQTGQAISVCRQLLERASPTERESILALLADAYRKEGKYDQAVAALLDGGP